MPNLPPEVVAAVRSLGGASAIWVYEGLPHPRDEPELLARELKRVRPVEFLNDRFYPARQPLRPGDYAAVHEQAGTPGWFKAVGVRYCDGREEFGEVKLCLFHADFALEWAVGEDVRRLLLCFGCSEAAYFDRSVEVTSYTALTPALRSLLLHYRQDRPESEVWPPRV